MLLALLIVWLPNVVMAAEKSDDLQEFITKSASTLTRASDVIEVDLSQFTATTRTKTLEISTGKAYRFINGTLKADDSYSGSILSISNQSTVYWATNAIMQPRLVVADDYTTFSNYGVIRITGGWLYVDGGKINNYPYKSSSSSTTTGSLRTTLISTSKASAKNVIYVNSGSVDGFIYSKVSTDDIHLTGGYTFKVQCEALGADVFLDGANAKLDYFYNIGFGKRISLILTSTLVNKIIFQDLVTDEEDNVLAQGTAKFQLGQTDIKLMRYRINSSNKDDDESYEIYLENNQAKFRKKGEGIIKTADDLQTRLNEIAAKGTATSSKPETIEIPASGITIDKYITVPEKCHALLTGGTITIAKNVSNHYVFNLYKGNTSLEFKNIKFDCNNVTDVSTTYYSGYFLLGSDSYTNSSSLTFGEGFEFINVNNKNKIQVAYLSGKGSYVDWNSGHYVSVGTIVTGAGNVYVDYGRIESSVTAIEGNYVSIGKAEVIGSGTVIQCNSLRMQSNDSKITCLSKGGKFVSLDTSDAFDRGIFVGDECKIEVRKLLVISRYMPLTVYLCADANLRTYVNSTATTNILTIDGDWSNFTLEKAFMSNVDPSEYKYYQFINIPDDREIYYNEKAKTVSIRKKVYDEDDLQNWINGGGNDNEKGTEEDPKNIDLPSGGCVINDPVSMGSGSPDDDLQWFINGAKGDGTNKDFVLKGSGSFTIKKYTTLTLTNLNLSNTGSGYIYVEGTLVIDVNINIVRLIRLVRVLPGGRVIWKGANGSGSDITKEFFYIEDGGVFEYSGGTISGGEYGFHNDGILYIYGGNISGTNYGGYTYSFGTTTISGGTISGGYYNGGKTIISGGTFIGGGSGIGDYVYWNGKGGTTTITGGTFGTSGNGTIYNGGNLYLGGNGYTYDYIYNGASGRIYIIGKLNIIIRIHINITDIVLDTPIILGGSDYVLTAEDIKKIQIILPDGYTWRYDASRGGIIITSTTGIKDVTVDADNKVQYFDASGRKIEKLQKGLNIVKTSDGKTKKVMIK